MSRDDVNPLDVPTSPALPAALRAARHRLPHRSAPARPHAERHGRPVPGDRADLGGRHLRPRPRHPGRDLDPRPGVRRRRRGRPRRDGRDLAGRSGRRLPIAGGPARRGVLPRVPRLRPRADRDRGEYGIFTLKPGRVPDGEGGLQAPHIDVSVFARGILDRVVTRIYFADEAEANAEDVVLRSVPEDARARR